MVRVDSRSPFLLWFFYQTLQNIKHVCHSRAADARRRGNPEATQRADQSAKVIDFLSFVIPINQSTSPPYFFTRTVILPDRLLLLFDRSFVSFMPVKPKGWPEQPPNHDDDKTTRWAVFPLEEREPGRRLLWTFTGDTLFFDSRITKDCLKRTVVASFQRAVHPVSKPDHTIFAITPFIWVQCWFVLWHQWLECFSIRSYCFRFIRVHRL